MTYCNYIYIVFTNKMSLKAMKDWALPLAIIAGSAGGFPMVPNIFLALSQYELYQWGIVFVLVYGLSATYDVQNALIITVSFYLASKLLALRDVVQAAIPANAHSSASANIPVNAPQIDAASKEARDAAQAAAAEAAAEAAAAAQAAKEGFCGGMCALLL